MPDIVLRFEGLPPNPNVTGGKHWSANYRAKKEWKELGFYTAKQAYKGVPFEYAHLHYTVSVGDNRVHDDDNIVASFKSLRDGLKGVVIVDDSIDRITTSYEFNRLKPRGFTILITKKSPEGL